MVIHNNNMNMNIIFNYTDDNYSQKACIARQMFVWISVEYLTLTLTSKRRANPSSPEEYATTSTSRAEVDYYFGYTLRNRIIHKK